MLVESDTAHDRFNGVSAAAVSGQEATLHHFVHGTNDDDAFGI